MTDALTSDQTSRRSRAERQEPSAQRAARPLSPQSIAHLRKVLAEIRAFLDAQEPTSLDAAWMVMEAANDFGDRATIDACRRVIDASLNGGQAAQTDVVIVNDYFK
jgi:hypothetical protein